MILSTGGKGCCCRNNNSNVQAWCCECEAVHCDEFLCDPGEFAAPRCIFPRQPGTQSPSIAASSCTSAGGFTASTPNEGAGGRDEDEIWGLQKLGSDLEGLIHHHKAPEVDYSDAELLVAESVRVPVHRCILAARSLFFRRAFSDLQQKQQNEPPPPPAAAEKVGEKRKEAPLSSSSSNGNGKVVLDLAKLVGGGGKIGRQSLMIVLGLFYGGKLRRLEDQCGVSCMDSQCPHLACWPVIEFYLELLFTGCVFELSELKAMAQQQVLKLLLKAQAENVVQILAVANAQGCDQLQEVCVPLVAKSSLPLLLIERSLPLQLAREIASLRHRLGLHVVDAAEDKLCRRIYKALDSDDIELMDMLLKEANVTVDSVFALHYAASFCDVKTFQELLELGVGDVNLRDRYGYTVLHVATLRRDPQVVGLLLAKGASPLDTTPDGYTALQMSRRIARNIESLDSAETREDWLRDKICVEILEQAENVNPCPVFPAVGEKELFMRLLYLENRVAFARLLWPRECKVVLGLSQVDTTKEFTAVDESKLVDLNKEPSNSSSTRSGDSDSYIPCMNETLLQRVNALQKATEVGHRFFPRCTAILNKYMDDGSFEHACIQNRHIPEDQLMAKRKRVSEDKELKNRFAEAYQRDVEEHHNNLQLSSVSGGKS